MRSRLAAAVSPAELSVRYPICGIYFVSSLSVASEHLRRRGLDSRRLASDKLSASA